MGRLWVKGWAAGVRRWAAGRGRMTWAELGWAISGLGWPTGYWAAWVDLLLLLFFLFSFSSQLKTTSLNSNPMHSTKIKPCSSMNAQTF